MPWQAQAEETRRVLREMCDAADRAIDDQVSRSSGGALPKKQRLSGAWHERRNTSQYPAVDTLSVTARLTFVRDNDPLVVR